MRKLFKVLALCVAVLAMTACGSQYRDLEFSDLRMVSVSPRSAQDIGLTAELTVSNPGRTFVVDTLEVTLKAGDSPVVYLRSGGIEVEGKTSREYTVPMHGSLAEGIGLFTVMGTLMDHGRDALKADVRAKVKTKCGLGKTLEYNDIQL